MMQLKNRKAAAPENMQSEMMKLLADAGMKRLTSTFKGVYKAEIPTNWLKLEIIPLVTKPDGKNVKGNRNLSLMTTY